MEVASSSSATGKTESFSRLESGYRQIEISARLSNVPWKLRFRFSHHSARRAHPQAPKWRARVALTYTQPQRRRPADVYTKRRRSAPRARRIEQVRARRGDSAAPV